MILIRPKAVILLAFLSVHLVLSFPSEVDQLKTHFYANLLEETRDIALQPLTDEIERSISLKASAFLETISEPSVRSPRDDNSLVLNEKTTDIFVLKGFESRGFVPVNFPQDICMFQINRKIFAVGLSYGKTNNETSNPEEKLKTLSIFVRTDSKVFMKIYEYRSKLLSKIDCQATKDKGLVAVVNTISDYDVKNPEKVLEYGSFVLSVSLEPSGEPRVETFQRFALSNQNGVRMESYGDNVYLIFSYNTNSTSKLNACTIYKLARTNFNPIDDLPCQNTREIEFFTVNHNLMVFIGNYRANNGTSKTFSSILRYDLNSRKFIENQKILTNAIGVAKYFFLDHQDQRQHFLFIGNTFEINEFGEFNYDVPSMIYKFVNGFFIPMQTINVKLVQAVLPLIGKNNQFHLLIASQDREVQIYYYDGWKFNESPIDFTGDAFKAGVVSMRSYEDIINGTTTIVISNQDSFAPTWNVYTPIYALKNDSSRLQSSITKWCKDAIEKLDEFDASEAEKTLKAAFELTDPSADHANFMGRIFLSNSSIGNVTANQLKGKRVVFNNETALRIDTLSNRLQEISNDAQQISNKIRFTMATRRSKRQAPLMVRKLIVDGPLNVESINGFPISDLVYTMSTRNPNLKDVIANEVLITNELFVSGKIDGVELVEDNVILDLPSQLLRPFAIDKLTAASISDVSTVNNLPFNEFFRLLRKKLDFKVPSLINQLNVEEMTIGELLNQRNFTALAMKSLKTIGDQLMEGVTNIGRLKANRIMFSTTPGLEPRISGQRLSNLININDTSKKVNILQDIRFTDELNINRLLVTERINNINVNDGLLQVLRKQGPPRQFVTGEKFFDEVNLLSPILLQGKIESKTLEKMNPVVTVNENLVLQGDYDISGPVLVRRLLNVSEDITTLNPELNYKNLLENGLNLFTTTRTNSRLVFKNLLEVRRNLQVETLNQKPVASFVKADFPELQVVNGVKTFKNGLLVDSGTVQADFINDVDIKQLNSTTLKRSSVFTQFIDGNVEIVDLKTPQLVSPTGKVSGKSATLILNANKNQKIEKLILNQAEIKTLQALSIIQQPGRKVFGNDLNFLISDAVTRSSAGGHSTVAFKKFAELNVKHLIFSEDNAWKAVITNYENSIAQDINVTDSWVFNNQLKVGNLEVSGTINEVSYHDMTHNWLQVEGDQIFTAPQTIESMAVDKNLELLRETINGVNIGKLVNESIWIDKAIYVEKMDINGEMTVRGEVSSQSVNDMSLDRKLILNNTNEYQTLKKLVVESNLAIEFINFTNVNGIDCARFMKAFGDNSEEEVVNLVVYGTAEFNSQPRIVNLNDVNLENLHESVWMTDRDVVLTGDNIQFLGGVRSDAALYSDTLNEKDLNYLYQNYLSLTSNQNIGTYLKINGSLVFNKALFTEKAILHGSIKIDEKDKGLMIEEFATSILRLDKEQKINGNWAIKKLVVQGDYDGLINGLNFHENVLHTGNWETAVVTGSKRIGSIEAYDVKTPYINGIDIMDWIENAVILNPSTEQNIDGMVELASQSVFYDNIDVAGPVNGIKFNQDTVLMKSRDGQVINGDLIIQTMTAHGVKPLFIDSLNLIYGINGRNITDIYQNTLKVTDGKIDSNEIVFDEKLAVGSIEIGKNIYDVDITEFLKESDASGKLVKFQENLKQLTNIGYSLTRSLNDPAVELNHFEQHQLLQGTNIQKTVPLIIHHDSTKSYVIAVQERNASFETVNLYRWSREARKFIEDDSITTLKYSTELYQITKLDKVVYRAVDHLYVELFDKNSKQFFQNLLQFDSSSGQFVAILQHDTKISAQLFTVDDGSSACYGVIFPSLENLDIACHGLEATVLKTDSLRKVSSQDGIIILLTEDHQLQIWYQRKIRQVLKVINPQSFASVKFEGKYYLAVSSDKVEQSIHHGSIEIFESSLDDINFKLVQSLELENPFLVKFSVIPSDDLLLYILTKNAGKTLSIYKFAGASYFVETIGSSTIVNTASDLTTIRVDDQHEFVAIVSGDVYIIEAVMKKY